MRSSLSPPRGTQTPTAEENRSEAPAPGEAGEAAGAPKPRADTGTPRAPPGAAEAASPPPGPARSSPGGTRRDPGPRRAAPCARAGRPRRNRPETGGGRRGGLLTRGRSLEIGKKRRLKLSATSTAWSGGGGSSCGSEPRAGPAPAARRAAISSRCLRAPLPLPAPRRKQRRQLGEDRTARGGAFAGSAGPGLKNRAGLAGPVRGPAPRNAGWARADGEGSGAPGGLPSALPSPLAPARRGPAVARWIFPRRSRGSRWPVCPWGLGGVCTGQGGGRAAAGTAGTTEERELPEVPAVLPSPRGVCSALVLLGRVRSWEQLLS